jgi:hypothetical protein
MESKSDIWFSTQKKPYTHGSGSFKDALQAEYVKGSTGFNFAKVRTQLPGISPTEIVPNCVIVKMRVQIVPLEQGKEKEYYNQTDKFMRNTATEIELQSRFAVDGFALPILGFIAKKGDNVLTVQYGVPDILASIRSVPYYPVGTIDGCYVLMLKCGFNESGVVMKLFDSPPQDKQVIVDSVIEFIDYAVEKQNLFLYDFKPPNTCRSAFTPGKIVGLDFDPQFCIDVSSFANQVRPQAIMKGYMFLMFACFQYQFYPKDPKITIALYNGLLRLHVNKLLEYILRNQQCVSLFKHYLKLNPQLSAIEVRDILRHRYIGTIAAEAGVSTVALAAAKAPEWEEPMLEEKGGRKKKRNKTTRNKSKRMKSL